MNNGCCSKQQNACLFLPSYDKLASFIITSQVESLTAARQSAMLGSEPSDAIRVVNALLTQLDQIKRHPNVLILTTSNVTGAIDLAFVDRWTTSFSLFSLRLLFCVYLSHDPPQS